MVTNDKKHVEKYFPNDEVISNTMEKDFVLLNSAKYLVISNSSFAWWAAWLNNNTEKKVIIPSAWFGPAYANHDTKDLYCENWIKI